MAWINKLSRQNYVVRYVGAPGVFIENQRTQERIRIDEAVGVELALTYGTALTPERIIDHCIEQAIIPHPYDEFV